MVLGKYDLNKREMSELVMQTAEPASTREATDRMVKISNSTYTKAELKYAVDNASYMNSEERILLLSLIENSEDLFYDTLGNWATDPVDLEINPYSKPFNSRYYPVPIINMEIFRKELKLLL